MASKFFMVKGEHSIEGILEINHKAHIRTAAGTMKIKESMHSNTFFVNEGSSTIVIPKIYETAPLCHEDVLTHIEECSLGDICSQSAVYFDLESILLPDEIEVFVKNFALFRKGTKVVRVQTTEILKVVCYMQSLSNRSDFNLMGETPEGSSIKEWALSNFSGASAEIGFYTALWLYSTNRIKDLATEWSRADLSEPDIAGLLVYLNQSNVKCKKEIAEAIAQQFKLT